MRRSPLVCRFNLTQLEDRLAPATMNWTGGPGANGTNWFDAANWDIEGTSPVQHAVPGINDDADIGAPNVGGPSTIVVNASAGVRSLFLGRNLSITSGTFAMGGGFFQYGNYQLNGGTLDIQNGTLFSTLTIGGAGNLTVAANRTVSLHATTIDLPVTNNGTMISPLIDSISGFTVDNAMTNAAGGTLWIQGGTVEIPGAFLNQGTVRMQSVAAIMPTQQLTLLVSANSTNASGGVIDVQAGTGGRRLLRIGNQATVDNQGTIQTAGVNLTIDSGSGGAVFKTSGTLAIGAGTTIFDGGFMTINYNGGPVTGGGTWDWTQTGTTVVLNSSFANTGVNIATNSGTTVNGPGTFTNATGRTTIAAGPTFNAAVINQNGATLAVTGRMSSDTSFANHGTVDLTSTVSQDSGLDLGGTFTNHSDGVINSLAGAGGSRTIRLVDGTLLDNQGTIHVISRNLSIFGLNAPTPTFKTSGTLSIDAGFTLTSGSSLIVDYRGGTLVGSGTWSVTGSFLTFNLNADFTTGATPVNVDNTLVNGPGQFIVGAGSTFTVSKPNFNAAVINNGTLIVNGSDGNGGTFAGNFTNAAGRTVNLTSSVGGISTEFSSGLINNGTLNLDSAGTGNYVEMYVHGLFTNSATGSLVSIGGAAPHDIRFYSGNGIANFGAITLNGAGLRFRNFGGTPSFQNSGAVAIGSGTTFTSEFPMVNTAAARVAGNGTFAAAITGTGTVSPGASPGLLTVNGNVSLGGFVAEINGATAGTQYDRLAVTGTVSLGGTLTAAAGFASTPGDVFRIIDNNGTDAVVGTFNLLPQNAVLSPADGGQLFRISYTGGDQANDVTLTRIEGVAALAVNDAAIQRSRVASVKVVFDSVIAYAGAPAAAYTLQKIVNGVPAGTVGISVTTATVGGHSEATISFTSDTTSGSLNDGRYRLTALANQITLGGQNLAANSTTDFHRFYGDMNGDSRVDISDFGFFSLAYLTPANYNVTLDFNNDSRIDIADFGQFSLRYFTTLP